MHNYFIESFKITKLWGYRDIDLTFHKDVNVLIGPNGSGKTTILNLLHSILSFKCQTILDIGFDRAEIKLKNFEDSAVRTVEIDITDKVLKFKLDEKEQDFGIITAANRRIIPDYPGFIRNSMIRRRLPQHFAGARMVTEDFYDELTTLVPLVWLPVNRRSPIIEEDEEERQTKTEALESVDLRLEDLLEDLSRYHSILNAQLSERYREFERQVLSVILFSKEHDQLKSIRNSVFHSPPTEAEKDQLLNAFEAAGFLDESMQSRIDDHFAAFDAVKKVFALIYAGKDIPLEENTFVIPLIGRTKAMVKYAGELEEDKERIFASLRLYEETVNSFLNDKSIKVDENGLLKIKSLSPSELNWHFLSSGEKQILTLLTQALLKFNTPVVYIADEPELSLHITWQEKLLKSLVKLGGQMQVIVATHSPDIVGNFQDKVIDLGRKS